LPAAAWARLAVVRQKREHRITRKIRFGMRLSWHWSRNAQLASTSASVSIGPNTAAGQVFVAPCASRPLLFPAHVSLTVLFARRPRQPDRRFHLLRTPSPRRNAGTS